MSRIGRLPVAIPNSVTAQLESGVMVVKGPKGEIRIPVKLPIEAVVESGNVIVSRKNELKTTKALHGAVRNLIKNAVIGVTEGYKKTLQLIGTGYRVKLEGKNINMSLGYSHPVIVEPLPGIEFAVDGQDKIMVSGPDKQIVGQMCANIRKFRPPEPYKGKGIRYENEVIKKKAGKTSKGE
jgi:large subunit ribosomal protein L6